MYLGGFFQSFGPRIGPLVAIDKATNRALQWPQLTGGSVLHVLPDPDGGYVVHHEYQTTDGQRGHRLVRLTAAGEIDQAFQWGYTGTLNTVVLAGDRLVVSAYADGVPGYASAIVDRRSGRLVAGPLPLMVSGGGTGPDGAPSGTITAMAMAGAERPLLRPRAGCERGGAGAGIGRSGRRGRRGLVRRTAGHTGGGAGDHIWTECHADLAAALGR